MDYSGVTVPFAQSHKTMGTAIHTACNHQGSTTATQCNGNLMSQSWRPVYGEYLKIKKEIPFKFPYNKGEFLVSASFTLTCLLSVGVDCRSQNIAYEGATSKVLVSQPIQVQPPVPGCPKYENQCCQLTFFTNDYHPLLCFKLPSMLVQFPTECLTFWERLYYGQARMIN